MGGRSDVRRPPMTRQLPPEILKNLLCAPLSISVRAARPCAPITRPSTSLTRRLGKFTFKDQSEQKREALERAAGFRARQSKTVDAVKLVREGREALDPAWVA